MKFDYGVAADCIATFKQLNAQALELVQSFKATADKANAAWDGDADTAYQEEITTCMTRLVRTPEMIEQCAQAMQSAVEKFQAAESEISAFAKSTIVSDTAA
jgi:WXG100 family type VII secretion target